MIKTDQLQSPNKQTFLHFLINISWLFKQISIRMDCHVILTALTDWNWPYCKNKLLPFIMNIGRIGSICFVICLISISILLGLLAITYLKVDQCVKNKDEVSVSLQKTIPLGHKDEEAFVFVHVSERFVSQCYIVPPTCRCIILCINWLMNYFGFRFRICTSVIIQQKIDTNSWMSFAA